MKILTSPVSFLAWCAPVHLGELCVDEISELVLELLGPVVEDGHCEEVVLLALPTQDGTKQVRRWAEEKNNC